jgi:hypothetical protein
MAETVGPPTSNNGPREFMSQGVDARGAVLGGRRSHQLGSVAMGKKYYYDPFGAITHHDGAFQLTQKKYEQKNNCTIIKTDYNVKTKSGVRHRSGQTKKPLENIEDDSTLVIMGHGDWQSNTIQVKTKSKFFSNDRGWFAITVGDLVTQLMYDGLPRTHRRIRLLTCWGGGLNKWDGVNDPNKAAVALAKVLAESLGFQRYYDIAVGGYCGPVISVTQRNKVVVEQGGGVENNIVAQTTRDNPDVDERLILWFDCAGFQVEKPK